MQQVGEKGPFQQRFNLLFNLVFTVFISMPYLNIVMAMAVPGHWCYVPGREHSNYTIDQWKELTIPRDATEDDGFSKCLMYNASSPVNPSPLPDGLAASANESVGGGSYGAGVVGCQNGWEYDKTWYTLTAPSQENWVCNDSIYVSNVFAFSRAGDVLGSFVFGQLGDSIGRRPVFFVTLLLLVVGRGLAVVTAGIYPLFLIMAVVGSVPSSAAFQSPFTVGMEVSAGDKRGHIAMLQCLGWTLGICAVPLLAWAFTHWVTLMLITTLPCVPFIFLHKKATKQPTTLHCQARAVACRLFTESPRWLASRGETGRCREVLEYIARVNGTQLPPETDAVLERIAGQREKSFGLASLFSSRRLAVVTVLISYSWFINSVTYYTLMLHVNSLSGNPFLNYLWQSLVELPGYIIGQWACDRYGRRWSQAVCFLLLTFAYLGLVGTVANVEYSLETTLLVVFAKFCVTITFYVIYLQCMEIYPTCGEYDARFPHAMMSVLAASGALACSFLPETLHQQLPETLADAHRFGTDQRYWQFRYRPRPSARDAPEKKPPHAHKEGVS
ncbi:Uncharacterized protein GBIM_12174 [Gryllus bimaculatus]|nr:Uncharacterized protein GBIM_12174 [Gryllus bimaculatus]